MLSLLHDIVSVRWFATDDHLGFTLIELLMVALLLGLLSALVTPHYALAVERARITHAVGDISALQANLTDFRLVNGEHPTNLATGGLGSPTDPWGNPYQYLRFKGVKGKGKFRKNKFLVPINSDYDLYSSGPDGQSLMPLTAKASKDDIVRANDGGFIGVAEKY